MDGRLRGLSSVTLVDGLSSDYDWRRRLLGDQQYRSFARWPVRDIGFCRGLHGGLQWTSIEFFFFVFFFSGTMCAVGEESEEKME